jgi:hypothetical protein
MIDLSDCTFIIPLKIDSPERKRNIDIVLSYLTSNFITTVVVYEADTSPRYENTIKEKFADKGVYYEFKELKWGEPFHRTRYLNSMLMGVSSKITINYDTDVILPVESYVDAANMIRKNSYDLVYPYATGEDSQVQISIRQALPLDEIISSNFTNFGDSDISFHGAKYGFCQFFNTASYKLGFMENELFVSWGPEDYERYYRFKKLGFKIGRVDRAVVHLEHPRGEDAGPTNPRHDQNVGLYNSLFLLDKDQIKKWTFKCEWFLNRITSPRLGIRDNFFLENFKDYIQMKQVPSEDDPAILTNKFLIKDDGKWKTYDKYIFMEEE